MSTIKNITARLAGTPVKAADSENEYKMYSEVLARRLKTIFNSHDTANSSVVVTVNHDEDNEAYVVVVQNFSVEASAAMLTKLAKALDADNMTTMFVGLHKGKPALMFM